MGAQTPGTDYGAGGDGSGTWLGGGDGMGSTLGLGGGVGRVRAVGVGEAVGAPSGLGVGGGGVARSVGLGVRRGVGAVLFPRWTIVAVAWTLPADDPSRSVVFGVDTNDGLRTAEGCPVMPETSVDDDGAGVPVADSTLPSSPRDTSASPMPRTAIAVTTTATAPASRRWSSSALAGTPPGTGRPVRWEVTGRTGTDMGIAPDWAIRLASCRREMLNLLPAVGIGAPGMPIRYAISAGVGS